MTNAINWQRPSLRAATTLLTLGMMVLIFFFSTENAEHSDETSGVFSRQIISVLYPRYQEEKPVRQKEIYDLVQHYVRKSAHFLEYLVLGALIRWCLLTWFGDFRLISPVSWLAGTLYAMTDEWHQLLIDGRSGQWTDVLLDSAGVLTGVVIACGLLALAERIRGRRRRDGGL